MKITMQTDIGLKRSNNQDSINKYTNKHGLELIVLADGMGGHRAGNIASEMAVTDLGRSWVNSDFKELSKIRDWMFEIIEEENQKIYELGQTEDYKGMGTTIEAAAFVGNVVIFAHVGDSRVGLIRDGIYTLLTSDHSLVNALVKAGQLTEEEAAVHPQKNIITQSVGQAAPLDIDVAVQVLQEGDYLLINSDGLTNMVSNEDITSIILEETDLDSKVQALIDQANFAGGLDNITVALLEIESEATK
ncbi:Stp1/IreP family PP2C-type Ser/Thr phosphatase [Streptococcus plurextorum]|uniref:Stp1/IreP family PP2C-type Ser/Thr phosphatase n=1 Tax=Streptococcus plurextorum TaxID=456876 RepID=UPI00048412EA|nr:Stp1/IreP family PP2C-type Ser/Thr phosphatase [Streptococcus plurextorum]